MNFFCSKDCPDLCAMHIDIPSGKPVITPQAEAWSSPGFVCGKFSDFAVREVNNGLVSWQKTAAGKQEYPTADNALKALADWLAPLRQQRILYLRGSGSLGYNMGYWDQLFSGFSQCFEVGGDPCNATGNTAHQRDFGCVINPCVTRLTEVDTVILYGKNAAATSPHLFSYLKTLKKSGKSIILIDPIKTPTAALADHYIQIRPACDGLLACALLTELGLERDYPVPQLLDTAGIDRTDFDLLLKHLRNGKVAHVQGLGIQRQENGMNAIRWINRLAHLTGMTDYLYYGHKSKRRWQPHPARFAGRVSIEELPVRLAAGEFDLFVTVAANPAVTYPDSQMWAAGLSRTRTLVIDTNASATSAYGDFFLKVGGMFAQQDFQGSYFFPSYYSRPALTHELSDSQAALALAGHLGIPMLVRENEQILAPEVPPRHYRTTDLDLHWPQKMRDLRLLTSSHPGYLNSQIVPGREQGLQVVHINPIDAELQEITTNDTLRIEGDCGAFSATALVTDDVPAGTLMCWKNLPMLDGFCNSAVPGRLTDSEDGLAYYAAEVRVFKIGS